MPNDINKSTNDPFSDLFRSKLENHQMPVDAGMWEAIESKLAAQAKSKKRIIPFWWITTGIAAAVALLFVFNIPSVVDQPINVAQQVVVPIQSNKNASVSTSQSAPQVVKPILQQASTLKNRFVLKSNPTPKLSSAQNIAKQKNVFNITNETEIPTEIANGTTPNALASSDAEKLLAKSSPNLVSPETPSILVQNGDSMPQTTFVTEQLAPAEKNTNTPKLELKADDWTDPLAKKKSGRGWELIAMAGSSGNSGSGMGGNADVFADLNDVSYFNYVNPELGFAASKVSQNYMLPLDSYNEQNHFAPISAGAAISFSFTDRLSVETGLNYSYLLSTYQNTSTNSDARSHLHYLGIPLRLSYRYAQAAKWQFYVSGGAMLEKGLWQLQVQNQRYSNQVYTTRAKDNIDGVQWSIQASTGVGYTLFKNTSLYFEPKVAWYFDNNQPTSIRTESKLSIGFEAGLRFKIN